MKKVIASSFADPDDVRRFKACKEDGGTDKECFKVGDNGIGFWGEDTTADTPICALPVEEWQAIHMARGARVRVRRGNLTVICRLLDTMPHRRFITNGAGIDLNPCAARALGLVPPFLHPVEWEWVD